jgi:dissimilatory sulfite reductase related protein
MVAPVLTNVNFDAEGFMVDKSQWSREIAEEIARQEGIESLTEAHWKIIDFCRKTGEQTGKAPTLRTITDGTGVSTKELFALYPKGPAKKVAKISGLGKPEGCV